MRAHDKQHESALDGHAYSAVSGHHDGQFAHNTAATATHSRAANWEHYLQNQFPGVAKAYGFYGNTITDDVKGPAQKHLANSHKASVATTKEALFRQRELYVGNAETGPKSSFGDTSAIELATLAIGMYALLRMF